MLLTSSSPTFRQQQSSSFSDEHITLAVIWILSYDLKGMSKNLFANSKHTWTHWKLYFVILCVISFWIPWLLQILANTRRTSLEIACDAISVSEQFCLVWTRHKKLFCPFSSRIVRPRGQESRSEAAPRFPI